MHRTQRVTVGSVMTTDLLTVQRHETLDLAALVMDRRRIRQLIVVDDDGLFLGLVSYRALLRLLADQRAGDLEEGVAVGGYMDPDVLTVTPGTPLQDAIRLMLAQDRSVIPVVEDGRVIGILSEHDVVRVTAGFLEPMQENAPGA